MKTFFERLLNYWTDVGMALRGESSVARIFPNGTDVGTARERLYVEFLRAHVPAFCAVKLGGFVFGTDGSESKQIDVLVTSGAAPQFDFLNNDGSGKSFASVDGLVAAVSLKSCLDAKEIKDAVENLASLPQVTELGQRYHPQGPPIRAYNSWPLKIVYAPDGVGIESARDSLKTACVRIPSCRRPDILHVSGKYLLVKNDTDRYRARDGTVLPSDDEYIPSTQHPDPQGFGMVVQRIQEIEQHMRLLLLSYDYLVNNLPM